MSRSACDRLDSAKEYRDQGLKDGQEVAAVVLFAEGKMGGLLAERKPPASIRNDAGELAGDIRGSLPEGISRDMSSQCQALHRNPEVVERVIAAAKAVGCRPSSWSGGGAGLAREGLTIRAARRALEQRGVRTPLHPASGGAML